MQAQKSAEIPRSGQVSTAGRHAARMLPGRKTSFSTVSKQPSLLLLGVILGLGVPEFGVFARSVGEEVRMVSDLYHLPAVENGDLVAELAGGEPVADIDGRPVTGDVVEPAVDFRFGDRVEGGGRFIQDDERGVLIEGRAIAIFCASPPETSTPSLSISL